MGVAIVVVCLIVSLVLAGTNSPVNDQMPVHFTATWAGPVYLFYLLWKATG